MPFFKERYDSGVGNQDARFLLERERIEISVVVVKTCILLPGARSDDGFGLGMGGLCRENIEEHEGGSSCKELGIYLVLEKGAAKILFLELHLGGFETVCKERLFEIKNEVLDVKVEGSRVGWEAS